MDSNKTTSYKQYLQELRQERLRREEEAKQAAQQAAAANNTQKNNTAPRQRSVDLSVSSNESFFSSLIQSSDSSSSSMSEKKLGVSTAERQGRKAVIETESPKKYRSFDSGFDTNTLSRDVFNNK